MSAVATVVLEELEIWTTASPAYLARRGTPRTPAELSRHEGAGISAFPNVAALREDVDAGRLVRLFPGWGMRRMFHYAAYPGNIAPPAKTRAFIDLAKEMLRH